MLSGEGPIVMVDDSESDLLVAKRCYERSCLDRPFVLLTSGEALLAHLDRVERGDETMPSLVLLDINMPGLNGFDVLQDLRARPRFERVPVVMMLTNSDNPKDVERSREYGASGFQVKPLRVAEYVAFFDSLAAGGVS